MSSPGMNTENFSAAVDFLGSLDNVDREKIGVLGICGFGGFVVNAAVSDPRIKAVAASTMYDITRVITNGHEIDLKQNAQGSYDRKPAQAAEDRYNMRLQMNNAPNEQGSWADTAMISMANMPILQYAKELKAPALIIHGEKAYSRYFSEDVFKSLGSQNKELYIVPSANHIDLYDNKAGKIPYDKFEEFFKANLK